MKQKLLTLAVLMALSTTTYAGNNDGTTCNGNGSCATTNNTTNNTTNAGGAGGAGGYGIGVGVGLGGSVDLRNTNNLSNTSSNVNANVNSNTNANTNTVRSENNNTNVGINGQDQSQKQGQGQVQGQSANNEGVTGNSVSINVAAPKTYRPPVNSAFAPTIFPTAPCMGSSSVGATGTLFSISGGTTWTSEECMILETARSFDQAGYHADGLAVRCQGKWAKASPSCKALAEGQKASDVANAKRSEPVEVKANDVRPEVAATYSENGYYSVVTNPIGQ